MSLPPEVLALLGDDATPEEAASGFVEQSESSSDIATHNGDCAIRTGEFEWRQRAKVEAWSAWAFALAAAAIRAMEAEHAHFVAVGRKARRDTKRLYGKARVAYDALRNWRKP